MGLIRFAYLSCSAATTVAAFVAATYWYLSSRPTPRTMLPHVTDTPEANNLGTQVDIASIHLAMLMASHLNKKAAAWSAVAAFLGGLTSALGFACR